MSVRARAVALWVLLVALGAGSPAAASSHPAYVVRPGDSLWAVGRDFGVQVAQLMELNGLTSPTIYPGQRLLLPLPPAVYRVKPGDSLYLIGRRFDTGVEELVRANNLSSDLIYPGQRLTVPEKWSYTVRAGDSLYILANRFHTTVADLRRWNDRESDVLYAGETLIVPSPEGGLARPPVQAWGPLPPGVQLYHVAPGDTLWGLAAAFNTTVEAIKATNHLQLELLLPGQPLFVPAGSAAPVPGITVPAVPRKPGHGAWLDWEFVNWLFNPGSTATLRDLATGRQFRVYRIGGANHADVEPLDAADTAAMREVFGGGWSWERRPVLLLYGDQVIAGSLAGQPHGFDTLPANGVEGMLDLHFLNSRTHNTGEIDPYHQESVRRAAGY
ncbi:MAG: LysM peptidoglycan-binding domain-containing protein [Firmicutes bacterium]|nr:LysM peptidoglycan-binding domain-containing protein [Bacillota bacterium]